MNNIRKIEGLDICFANLDASEIEFFLNRTNQIKDQMDIDNSNLEKYNKHLAGNIKHEYGIADIIPEATMILHPLVQSMATMTRAISSVGVNFHDAPVKLGKLWANFSKKYEFNPLHDHNGLLSFVIWLDIPYTIEDERKYSPGKDSNQPKSGSFSFVVSDPMFGPKEYTFEVDKSMNGTVAMFPSKTLHQVYPFYTSDDYRVTVAGNYYFDWS